MIDKANVGGTVHDINDTGARGMISPDVFSTAAAYEAGEYCIYNNTLYKFTEAKSAGAWDDSKASATDIASELSALNSSIEGLEGVAVLYNPASPVSFPGEINVDITEYRVICMIVYSGATTSSNRQHVIISTAPASAQYIPVQLGTTATYIRIEFAGGKLSLLSSGEPASVGAIYGIVK